MFEIASCRNHFPSMPSMGLSGKIPRVSCLSSNMPYMHHQKYLPLHTLRGNWYDSLSAYLLFLVPNCKFLLKFPMQAYVDAINGHKLQNGHANHAWLCIDLLDVLCQLAEKGHASVVWSILDYPLKRCPEILLLGMAHVNVQIHRLVFDYFCIVFLFHVLSFYEVHICSCRLLTTSSREKYL